MIEKELKVLLNYTLYKTVLHLFDWDETYTQINYYYSDNEFLLEQKKICSRVRVINGEYKLQIKMPVYNNTSLHIKDEYEEKIDELPHYISSSKLNAITKMSFDEAYKVGTLTTERRVKSYKDGITICLDKNSYLGIIDYELEIEFEDNVDEHLLNLLKKNEINFENTAKGKYSRFMKRLKKQC